MSFMKNFHCKAAQNIVKYAAVGRAEVENLRRLTGSRHRFEAYLVICDWNMAPVDGLTFCKELRGGPNSPNPYVPIIMLTGHTESERVLESREAGINHFLAKPVSVKALSDRIVSLIDHPRPFVRTQHYFGPDRRRKNFGPPESLDERRKLDPN